jgi:hypothetical protein
MAGGHLSVRIEPGLLDRLDRLSKREGMNRSGLAKTLLDEGLRMADHPGILFRSGPAGRRPALATGPDVWEVARVLRDIEESGEEAITRTAELSGLTPHEVRTVVRYYAAYREEIDEWLHTLDEEAERLKAAWEREQDLLRA